jgi:hypothetical protein
MNKIREYGGITGLMITGGFIGFLLYPTLFPVGQSYEVRSAQAKLETAHAFYNMVAGQNESLNMTADYWHEKFRQMSASKGCLVP